MCRGIPLFLSKGYVTKLTVSQKIRYDFCFICCNKCYMNDFYQVLKLDFQADTVLFAFTWILYDLIVRVMA